jgi:hypothetical protein
VVAQSDFGMEGGKGIDHTKTWTVGTRRGT